MPPKPRPHAGGIEPPNIAVTMKLVKPPIQREYPYVYSFQ